MTQGFSVWLDTLRILATLTVVASHVAYARFTHGAYQWMRDLNLGSDAVILFFVISGLVIARAADRDASFGRYAFSRATRIYTVMIPALLLTFTFDRIGLAINPASYPREFYQSLPLTTFLQRGLTFSNEWFVASPVRLGSNGPLWSLSYEVAYYALFGVLMFLTGPLRIVCALLLVLLAGPNVLLLMPSWLLGVWLWRKIKISSAPAKAPVLAVLLAILPAILYALALWVSLPAMLSALTQTLWPLPYPPAILRFSNEFLWNGLIGLLVCLHLIGMARLLADWRKGAVAVRWLAGASFSVYVTHYPALHLLDALIPAETWGRGLWLLIGSVAVGLAFAQVFERPLDRWRRLLWPGRTPATG